MRPALLFLLVSAALTACSPGNAGDPCTRPNTTDDCADGNICVVDQSTHPGAINASHWDTYTCRALCSGQADCTAPMECRAVSGALMVSACQPPRVDTCTADVDCPAGQHCVAGTDVHTCQPI